MVMFLNQSTKISQLVWRPNSLRVLKLLNAVVYLFKADIEVK